MRFLASLLLLAAAVTAHAGTPRVARVTPPGGQRGTDVTVELIGRNLDEPREVFFYEPGITVEAVEKVETILAPNGKPAPVDPGTRVRVKLKLAADCPLGAHGLRLRTADGLSEYHRFFVGPFPTVEEDEQPSKGRNDKRETAKAVPLNCTVFGKLNDPTDVDVYQVAVKKGDRLSAEIESARLGVDRGIPDLHLAFYDADGKKLAAADDSALFVQDPVLSVLAPRDGNYFVEVRHSVYNGTGEQYRLHVGNFPRPTAIYPAGGPAGTELEVEVLGDPMGKSWQKVKLPKALGDFGYAVAGAPSPNRLRVSPFPNVLEAEPNDPPTKSSWGGRSIQISSLPAAFNGVINQPGDVDLFAFRARKGEQFRFHAMANCLGSPADPVVWIKTFSGKDVTPRATDSRPNQLGYAPANGLNRDTLDPVVEFTAPADGEYFLGVEDERGEGGPDYVYRVEVAPVANAVYTYIAAEPENQNNPQVRQAIVLAPGNRWTSQVAIFSTSRPHPGDLEIVGVNLPKGVTVSAPKLTPGVTKVPVVFEAAADVKPQAALIELAVRPVKAGETLLSGYRQTILMNAYGNNDYYLHTTVDKLALAITDPAPFAVEVEEPKSSLVQNGEMLVNFRVNRQAGYDGPVTVMMDWKPNGINTATPVTMPAGKADGSYLLGASRGATAGKYAVTLTAVSGGSGRRRRNDDSDRTYVASRLFTVTVAEPHVEAKIPRTSIERGKTATITLKLNHLQKFDGKAPATLVRLPRGVELVEPTKEITSADKDVTFTLRATSEALVGNYQGVAMDLTVTENGQAVRQLSGYGQLRIDAERGAKPGK